MALSWKQGILDALMQDDFDLALRIKEENIPTRFFRYTSLHKMSLINLRNDKVWMSNPLNFNDPYDSAMAVMAKEGIMRKGWTAELQLPKQVEHALRRVIIEETVRFNEEMSTKFKNSVRVCCFSEVKDSILMWLHYASQHQGICIEYNFNELQSENVRRKWLFPIIYSKSLFDANSHFISRNFHQYLALSASITKNLCWKYEKEWRFVAASGTIPEKGGLWSMPVPKAIYLGSRITSDDFNRVIQISRKKKSQFIKWN
jgi:hypothetical protein